MAVMALVVKYVLVPLGIGLAAWLVKTVLDWFERR
jgi:hypothetical protein